VTVLVSIAGEILWPDFQEGINWLWVLRNCLVSIIFATVAMRYFYVQSQWRLKSEAELRARLAMLQANIRPHFFFNTLNTVASLIMIDPEKAEKMLMDLAQLFRAVLKNDEALVSFEQEIELAKRYLEIEQVRLGERMQVRWDLPSQLPNILLPPLVLQPLLENAVYHGIQTSIEPGFIRVELAEKNSVWQLKITNSKPLTGSPSGNQMALENIKARLATLPQKTKLETDNQDESYRVKIQFSVGAEE